MVTWSLDGDVTDYRPATEGKEGCDNSLGPKPAQWSFILTKDGQLVFSECYTDTFYIVEPKSVVELSDRSAFFESKVKRIDDYEYQFYFNLYSAK